MLSRGIRQEKEAWYHNYTQQSTAGYTCSDTLHFQYHQYKSYLWFRYNDQLPHPHNLHFLLTVCNANFKKFNDKHRLNNAATPESNFFHFWCTKFIQPFKLHSVYCTIYWNMKKLSNYSTDATANQKKTGCFQTGWLDSNLYRGSYLICSYKERNST
jgi:hypothetical protein